MSSRISELLPSAESGGLLAAKPVKSCYVILIVVFAPTGVLVMGLDITIESPKQVPPRGSIVIEFVSDSHG